MFPKDWSIKTIAEIATVTSGGTPSRANKSFWNGSIPWIRTTEVQNCIIFDADVKEYITEEGLKNSSAKLVPENSILLAMIGQGKTRGQVALLKIEAATNQNCASIILKPGQDAGFFYNYFLSQYQNIRSLSNSAGQSNLSGGLVKSIKVPVPPLSEQQKISKIISTWDKAIVVTEKLLANSQQRKKKLMQLLLSGSRRFSKGGKEWKKLRLGDIFSRVTTKNKELNTNVVTISGQYGLIRQEEFFKKPIASETLDGYFLLKNGQFAYNKSYSNGYPMGAIKRLNRYEYGVVTTLYICFELNDIANADSDYFEHFFESGFLNRGLSQIAHEGGRAHGLLNVKPSDFFGLNVILPPLAEQKKIASVISSVDNEIKVFQKELDNLKLEKIAIMRQLLTGKKRVVA